MARVKGDTGSSSKLTVFPPQDAAVWGTSADWVGVHGTSDRYAGVIGDSVDHTGVVGVSRNDNSRRPWLPRKYGVAGYTDGGDKKTPWGVERVAGVYGESSAGGTGVYGLSLYPYGRSSSEGVGVLGEIFKWPRPSPTDYGVGVWGNVQGAMDAVLGSSEDGTGVWGISDGGLGVVGDSAWAPGVAGLSQRDDAVSGSIFNGPGAAGSFTAVSFGGRGGRGGNPDAQSAQSFATKINYGQAGRFHGNVDIVGNLAVAGTKGFKIDHPVDPATKFLLHSAVESSDMKNLYDGIVTLDARGKAKVTLPPWFGALNKDLRFQLTAIGAAAPNLHVAEILSDKGFRIAGGRARMRVSWQVTGIRSDAWANAHRMPVEQRKRGKERGRYLHPELHTRAKGKKLEAVLDTALMRNLTTGLRLREMRKKRIEVVKRQSAHQSEELRERLSRLPLGSRTKAGGKRRSDQRR